MRRKAPGKSNVYLEEGNGRTIAAALDWPGGCRVGQDEASALQALFDYAPRYARVLHGTRLGLLKSGDVADLVVVERLKGNATADFGVPGLAPAADAQPLDEAELKRLQAILKACWQTFDGTIEMAEGKALRTDPRGGKRGSARYFIRRDAWHILDHVWEIEDRLVEA